MCPLISLGYLKGVDSRPVIHFAPGNPVFYYRGFLGRLGRARGRDWVRKLELDGSVGPILGPPRYLGVILVHRVILVLSW